MKHKLLSVLMALCLVLTLLPTAALAATAPTAFAKFGALSDSGTDETLTETWNADNISGLMRAAGKITDEEVVKIASGTDDEKTTIIAKCTAIDITSQDDVTKYLGANLTYANGVLSLSGDVTLLASLTVLSGQTLTINLNGHTLTSYGYPAFRNLGTLTVTGPGTVKTVATNHANPAKIYINDLKGSVFQNVADGASMTLNNITVYNAGFQHTVYSRKGTLSATDCTFYGGTLTNTAPSGVTFDGSTSDITEHATVKVGEGATNPGVSTATLTNCAVDATTGNYGVQLDVKNDQKDSTLTVSGCTITAPYGVFSNDYSGGGEISLTNTTVTSTVYSLTGDGKVTVNSGSYKGAFDLRDNYLVKGDKLTLKGGVFSASLYDADVADRIDTGKSAAMNADTATKADYPYTVVASTDIVATNDTKHTNYTNLADAINAAVSGDTVTTRAGTAALDKTATLKKGVTVVVDAGTTLPTSGTIVVNGGATLQLGTSKFIAPVSDADPENHPAGTELADGGQITIGLGSAANTFSLDKGEATVYSLYTDYDGLDGHGAPSLVSTLTVASNATLNVAAPTDGGNEMPGLKVGASSIMNIAGTVKLAEDATFVNKGGLAFSGVAGKVADSREIKDFIAITNSDGGVTSGDTVTYSYYAPAVVTPAAPGSTTPSTTTPGTTTTTNNDGSTTTTTTAANGTVTETTKATDGSTTETVTKPDGTKTETVTEADGSKTVTETAADGSTSSNGVDANGTTAEAKTDAAGNLTEAKADVTAATVAAAAVKDEPVTLPVEVPAATSAATAAEIKIDMPATVTAENPVRVEIPVEDVKPSTVIVLVNKDGSEEILKDVAMTEDGVVMGVDGDVTVKVIDNAKTFIDPIPAWAEESVDFVTSREIFNGGPDGNFSAMDVMSRGMIAQVLFNFDDDSAAPTTAAYPDTNEDNWWDDAANWAGSIGVANDQDGSFNGDADLTRQDLALMLYRYAQYKGYKTDGAASLGSFADSANVADYAEAAMQWAVGNGIILGTGEGVNPTGSATRGEVAAMIARFVNNIVK